MNKKSNIVDSTVQGNASDETATKVIKTKITLSITPEDSDLVKMYALKNHTTVSNLLHEWIRENCEI